MEKQIKSIINEKLSDINFKNNTNEKELKLLEKLCNIFPDLKDNTNNTNNTNNTVNNTNNTANIKEINKINEVVLDEIIINKEVFYKDKYGGIWNDKIELVGTVDKKNCGNCVLFSKSYNMDNNINNFI